MKGAVSGKALWLLLLNLRWQLCGTYIRSARQAGPTIVMVLYVGSAAVGSLRKSAYNGALRVRWQYSIARATICYIRCNQVIVCLLVPHSRAEVVPSGCYQCPMNYLDWVLNDAFLDVAKTKDVEIGCLILVYYSRSNRKAPALLTLEISRVLEWSPYLIST